MRISITETDTRLGFRFTLAELVAMNGACKRAKERMEGVPRKGNAVEEENVEAPRDEVVTGICDAAKRIGLTQSVICQAVSQGTLPFRKETPAGIKPRYVFKASDLDNFGIAYRSGRHPQRRRGKEGAV